MKKFKFSLNAVLRLREAAKERAWQAYGTAVQQRQMAENAVEVVVEKLKNLNVNIATSRESSFWASPQLAYAEYFNANQAVLSQLQVKLRSAKEAEANALKKFLSCKQSVEILEHLRDKYRRTHRLEILRHEAHETEESLSAKLARELAGS